MTSQISIIVHAFFVIVLMSPVVPLVFAWTNLMKRGTSDVPRVLLLLLVFLSCSSALLIAALFFKDALGSNYSMQRLVINGANWLLALISVVVASMQRSDRIKIPVVVSASLLLLIWSLNAALSSVV